MHISKEGRALSPFLAPLGSQKYHLMHRIPGPEVGVRASLGSNRAVSLCKAHLLPKSTGNTQEAVAPSQHD